MQVHLSGKGNAILDYNLNLSESVCIVDAEKQSKSILGGVKVDPEASRREVTRTSRTHRKNWKIVGFCVVSLVFHATGKDPNVLSEAQCSTVNTIDIQITLSSSL